MSPVRNVTYLSGRSETAGRRFLLPFPNQIGLPFGWHELRTLGMAMLCPGWGRRISNAELGRQYDGIGSAFGI